MVCPYIELQEIARAWPRLTVKMRLCVASLIYILGDFNQQAEACSKELRRIEALANTDKPD